MPDADTTTRSRARFFWTDTPARILIKTCTVPGYVLLRITQGGDEQQRPPLDIAVRAGDLMDSVHRALDADHDPFPLPPNAEPPGFGGGCSGSAEPDALASVVVFDIDRAIYWHFDRIDGTALVQLIIRQTSPDGKTGVYLGLPVEPASIAECVAYYRNTDPLEM